MMTFFIRRQKILTLFHRIILVIFMIMPAIRSMALEDITYEDIYLKQKQSGSYEQALNTLIEWTSLLDDRIMIEANIFRINEVMHFPEFFDRALDGCDKILLKNPLVKENHDLSGRIYLLKNQLFLRKGKTAEAAGILDRIGFIRNFKLIGPFKNEGSSGFNISYPPESDGISANTYQGKVHRVRWFDADVNLTGAFEAGERNLDETDCLYYLYREFIVENEGVYELFLGKTGYTDIRIDGINVFQNRKRHGFCADQYRMQIFLKRGAHKILIKLGDSASGIKLSLRITADKSRDTELSRSGLSEKTEARALISAKYFSSLDGLLALKSDDPQLSFLTAYLFYSSGLNSEDEREAVKLFSNVRGHKRLGPAGLYYLGIIENEDENRERFFYESLKADPLHLESLAQIVRIKLKNNFVYEAYPLIEKIKNINPSSVAGRLLMAECFNNLEWFDEMGRIAADLKKSQHPSAGYRIQARAYSRRNKYKAAIDEYRMLRGLDHYDRTLLTALGECYERCGDFSNSLSLFEGAIAVFPADLFFRIKSAELVKNYLGIQQSMPYLSAALKISPDDKRILYELGNAYCLCGKKDMGKYYLERALLFDPNNYLLKQYIENMNDSKNKIDEYLIKDDIESLARKAIPYKDEPAVMLLDECAIRVLSDGFHEKHVRKIYKINDPAVINNFSQQVIVINPNTDTVESLKCIVTNDGIASETTDSYARSLSDPESRMYYDLQARIVMPPSLKKGSIFEFRYKIKSRESESFKGYFGEMIAIGREFRTLKANTVISVPESKNIRCLLKRIDRSHLNIVRTEGDRIYHIYLEDIPLFKNEKSMPHYTEIQPCIYLTSHGNWNDAYRWYASLLRDRIAASDEMKNSVRSIINKTDSDIEKLRKIYNHVNETIRYVGFELGLGSLQPRMAGLTYKTGMGDCKDITLVLMAMLREAGIDASMALLKTRSRGVLDPDIPFIGQFNHAICFVNIKGGIFIDGTAKMSGFRELPGDERDVTAFVMDGNGYRFLNTGSDFYEKNSEIVNTRVTLHKGGDALLYREITRIGDSAQRLRYEFLENSQKTKKIREYWSNQYSGVLVKDLKIASVDIEKPVSYNYSVEIPSLASFEEGYIILKSFLVSSDYYTDYGMMRKRILPLVISGKFDSQVNIHYDIPEGYRVAKLPDDDRLVYKKFEAHFQYKKTGKSGILVTSTIRFKDYSVVADEYPIFRSFVRFIYRKENERIILKRDNTD